MAEGSRRELFHISHFLELDPKHKYQHKYQVPASAGREAEVEQEESGGRGGHPHWPGEKGVEH